MTTFPPFSELVPHTGAMVLLDAMTEWAPGAAQCSVTLREGARFVDEGRVEAVVTVEYMAQAVAACLGYEAFRGGAGVRVGMIIGARRLDFAVEHLVVGDTLRVGVQRIRGNEMLSHFDCEVWRGDERVSWGQLTLFHAERPPEM